MQQLQRAVKVLYQRSAAFNPIAVVAIQHALNVAHLGAMDVPAHHALITAVACLIGHGDLKVCHVAQGTFDFLL